MEIEMFLYEIAFLSKKASSNNATYLYLYLKLFSFFFIVTFLSFMADSSLLELIVTYFFGDELLIFRAEWFPENRQPSEVDVEI